MNILVFKIGRGQFGLLRALAVLLFYFMLGQPLPAFSLVNDNAADLVIAAKGDKRSKAPKLQGLKADDSNAFITVWEVPADDLEIYIPVSLAFRYNYSVILEKEGDPSSLQSFTAQTSSFYMTVNEAGRYLVKIEGEFPHFDLRGPNQKNSNKLVAVQQWGSLKWESFAYAFFNAKNLKSVPEASPDLHLVKDMSAMFFGAVAFNGDLSSWDVSKVEKMSGMFEGATDFNGDLSRWDVSKVEKMSFMFSGATAFNGDLSKWDVSNVNNMRQMFAYASVFNGDLSKWNVGQVNDMWGMFSGATAFNGDLSRWNVGQVNDMWGMFEGATDFNGDISSWNVSKVEKMSFMFSGATAFNGDISSWNVSKVEYMFGMLSNSGLSRLNYDKTLKGWAANPKGLQLNVQLGADGLNWCTAAAARDILEGQYGWRILGDKQKCIQPDANNILYVSKSGSRGGTGRSWADALPELADALSWARNQADAGSGWEATNPLKIYVAVGTYTPLYSAEDDKYTVDGKRHNSFVLVKNVQLYAGFDPDNGYDFHERVQPKAGPLLENPQGTILSADLAKNDKVTEQNGALDFQNYTDNAYHVLIAAGDLGEALLDGFVVQGGNAEDLHTIQVNTHDVHSAYGAGLHLTKANPLLKNLAIAYNKGDYGGGMYFNSSAANLFNISVNHNHAKYGGGINFDYSDANLFNISVNHNHAKYGGGIYHYRSNPSLSNMTITNNRASTEGAGMRNVGNSSPLVLNSILYGNTDGNSLANNVFNDNSSTATFHHSLLAGDGLWNPAWGKDGDANDGQNSVTDLDPFVDREQGDFRLKRASSAVDAGSMRRLWAALQKADPLNYAGPMPAVTDARWGMDLAGAARILDEQVDMGAYEFSCPTVIPEANAQQSFCADNVPTIARLEAKGEDVKWYSEAYGGILYPATEVLVDGQTYYASQTKEGCESQNRVAVEVKLIPLPDAPELDAIQQLSYGDTPLTLSATASMDCELRWYSAETGGTPSLQAPVAETNVIGEQFFWVSQVNTRTTKGCEGPRAKITVKINKAIPKLGALASLQKTYGDAPFTLSPPSSNSPGAFSYSSSATDVATVQDMEVTIIGAGTTRITVTQAATDYYSEATTSFDLLVEKAAISDVIFKDASYTYDGTAKSVVLSPALPSGVTVSYSNNSHSDAGTYTATASITGGTNYVDQSLTAVLRIAQKQQLISFGALAPLTKDAGLISLDISSNSSLPIKLYSENTAVATVAADGIQIVGAGTSVIRAEQAGDANHLAAAPVTQLLEVTAVKDPLVGIRVHQALSPNGDGINDFLRIDGIDNYPENKLLIFDSNGTVIQTIVGYNNHSNYFDAAKGSKLMAKGTYFYTLSVKMDGTWYTEKGFFVLRY